MIAKRQYLKNKAAAITFEFKAQNARNIESIFVVGDFNGWDVTANPMKKL